MPLHQDHATGSSSFSGSGARFRNTSPSDTIHQDGIALVEGPGEQGIRERVLDLLLDDTPQRPGTHLLVVTLLCQQVQGGIGGSQRHFVFGQAFGHLVQFQVHDLADVILVQRAEDDDAVQPVDELRAEDLLERLGQFLAHFFIGGALFGLFIALQLEAERGLFLDLFRADVGGHHDDGVAEIHRAALGVREMAFFHDLQEHVVDFGVGLLDLVEDHDGVRAAAQGFGQLTGIVVADVSGRRADQAAGGMAFHELGHVQLDQGFLAAEHELGQGLGQLGLANAGRTEEHERADRALRVFQPGACPPHRLGDGLDGFFLADDGLLEFLFHLQQAL